MSSIEYFSDHLLSVRYANQSMYILRSIESLYEELVEQGVIKKVQDIYMSDYVGEYSYLGTTLRQANIEPMPSLSDVRRVVTEFGVLPLGK